MFVLSLTLLNCSEIKTSNNSQSSADKDREPVNILFVFTDDQRWDALGYAGNPVLKTPNLDKLAEQGTYFDNAFVTTPICCVSPTSSKEFFERFQGYQSHYECSKLNSFY